MNDKPTIEVGKVPIITKFIYTLGVLPTSYLMSMTYQEQVTWLCNYIQQTLIPQINKDVEAIQELQNLYELLRTYVNDYFDNLDVQEEINNKLSEMTESGQLTYLISSYINPLIENQNEEISTFKNTINGEIGVMNSKLDSLASGSPLVANSLEGMTDTTKVYVLSTTGHWYYYNGEAWADGGVYQAVVNNDITSDTEHIAFDSFKVENNLTATTGILKGYGLNVTTGESLANRPKRARTNRNWTDIIKLAVLESDVYTMKPFFYSENTGNWGSSFVYTSVDFGNKFYLGYGNYAFALLFKRNDEADLTDDDIDSIRSSLHYYQFTDKTLTLPNTPADSKEVGDKINGVMSVIDNVYTYDNRNYIDNILNIRLGKAIVWETGLEGTNAKRARTGRLLGDYRGKRIVLDSDTYSFGIAYYTTDQGSFGEGYTNENEYWINETLAYKQDYYALVFKRVDEADLTATDIENIRSALHVYKIGGANYETASFSIYQKLGVCGDSRSSGYYYPSENSSAIENNNLSWLTNLARRNGCDFGIYAKEGKTTRQFLTDTNCLPKLLNDTACNLYFLCLGGNDASKLGMNYLGSIDDITADYHNNPDTFYGNYARIIEQILEHNPNAKLIMAMFCYYKSTHATNTTRIAFWNATKEIADHYGIAFLDWTNDEWYQSADFVDGLRHNHPSVTQYSGIAISAERLFTPLVQEYYNYFIDYTE